MAVTDTTTPMAKPDPPSRPARPRRTIPQRFGINLDAAIDAAGMTNTEVGNRAGLMAVEVSYYRNGKREPGVHKAYALARAVGVSLDELAGSLTPEEQAAERLAAALRAAASGTPRPRQKGRRARKPLAGDSPQTG